MVNFQVKGLKRCVLNHCKLCAQSLTKMRNIAMLRRKTGRGESARKLKKKSRWNLLKKRQTDNLTKYVYLDGLYKMTKAGNQVRDVGANKKNK